MFSSFFPKKKNLKVLDIGCGNARLYDFLLQQTEIHFDYTGIDISENLLEEAKKKYPQTPFFCESMTDLDSVKHETFDVIFFIASFHHLASKTDRLKVLEKVKHLLNDNGIICMTNWNLFQKKYIKYVWKAIFQSLFSLRAWNDSFIPFTKENITTWRYYHAFTPKELQKLFKRSRLQIVHEFFYEKEDTVKDWKQSRNICHILKKGE